MSREHHVSFPQNSPFPSLRSGKIANAREKLAGREKKGKRKGAAPSLPSFLPFYFRVRAFLIQRARLSRSLEQAARKMFGQIKSLRGLLAYLVVSTVALLTQ